MKISLEDLNTRIDKAEPGGRLIGDMGEVPYYGNDRKLGAEVLYGQFTSAENDAELQEGMLDKERPIYNVMDGKIYQFTPDGWVGDELENVLTLGILYADHAKKRRYHYTGRTLVRMY